MLTTMSELNRRRLSGAAVSVSLLNRVDVVDVVDVVANDISEQVEQLDSRVMDLFFCRLPLGGGVGGGELVLVGDLHFCSSACVGV